MATDLHLSERELRMRTILGLDRHEARLVVTHQVRVPWDRKNHEPSLADPQASDASATTPSAQDRWSRNTPPRL
jgi:hypothetical protein